MLRQLNEKIRYISYTLEFISMRSTERARLEDELSKTLDQRDKYRKMMEEYGWTKESSRDTKKK